MLNNFAPLYVKPIHFSLGFSGTLRFLFVILLWAYFFSIIVHFMPFLPTYFQYQKTFLLWGAEAKRYKNVLTSYMTVPLDLFDEELLQAIAYDPEAWIDQLLRDDRFKVIVVCSQVISNKF